MEKSMLEAKHSLLSFVYAVLTLSGKKDEEGQMGWKIEKVREEHVPPLLCDPSGAASIATSSQGQGESWEMGERQRKICTWTAVSHPVPLLLLLSPCTNHNTVVWWRPFHDQGPSQPGCIDSAQNIWKSLIKELLQLSLLLNLHIFKMIFKKRCLQTAL